MKKPRPSSTSGTVIASPPPTPPPLLIEESPSPPTLASTPNGRRRGADEVPPADPPAGQDGDPSFPASADDDEDDRSVIVIRDDDDDDDELGEEMAPGSTDPRVEETGKANSSPSVTGVSTQPLPNRVSTPPATKVDLDKFSPSATSGHGSGNGSPIKGFGGGAEDVASDAATGGGGAWICAKGPISSSSSLTKAVPRGGADEGPSPVPQKPYHGLPVGNGTSFMLIFY